MMALIIILAFILSAAIWWYTRPLTIEERQAMAIKRHKKSREADRKRADAYSDLRKALPILKGTTLHDLRHTFISTGDSLGVSPATVAALVGHAAKTQTGRYTHKFSPELSEAEQVIGGWLAGVMG